MLAALLLQAVPAAPRAPWAVVQTARNGHTATSSSAWSQDGGARLVVRCDTVSAPVVSIQFIPKGGFAAAQARPVSINIDDGGWLGTNWRFPGNGAFVSDDLVVTNLTAMIAHGKSIRVRATSPDDATVEATFTGPGEAPIRQVLAACGYPFGLAPQRAVAPTPAATPKTDPDDDQ